MNHEILLAEDGIDNQRIIARLIRNWGMNVVVVSNGQETLDLTFPPEGIGRCFDAILMDIDMPILDGYATTRELRRRGYQSPIIAVTTNTQPDDPRKCLDAGCNDYLPKPVNRQTLATMLAQYVGFAV
jgi:CheY-like chemotaxis protein